jgi:hypothetical protein
LKTALWCHTAQNKIVVCDCSKHKDHHTLAEELNNPYRHTSLKNIKFMQQNLYLSFSVFLESDSAS